MSDFGLTPEGFLRKRAEDIKRDMEQFIQSPEGLGDGVSVKDSPLEEIIGVVAIEIASVWEAAEQSYNSLDPQSAAGDAIDNLLALVGDVRRPARRSTGVIYIEGDAGVVVSAGFEVKHEESDTRFVTTEDVTLPGLAKFEALEFGDIQITKQPDTVVTVIAGVDDIVAVEMTPGRLEETDEEARNRRINSFQTLGRGTLGAIQAALVSGTRAISASVYEYPTPTPPPGHEPYSIEPFVYISNPTPEDEREVARILWDHASGIQFIGPVSKSVIDSGGTPHRVEWSWVREVSVEVRVTITVVDNSVFLPDGPQLIRDNVFTIIDALNVGDDVPAYQVRAATAVPGIGDADVNLQRSTGGHWDESSIYIADDEIAIIDAMDIEVIQ